MKKLLSELLSRANLRNSADVLYQGVRQHHTLFGVPDITKQIAFMSAVDISPEVTEQIIDDKSLSMQQRRL